MCKSILPDLDFSREEYRGYVITTTWHSGMQIEKGGMLVHKVPGCESWTYARMLIDMLEDIS